MNKITKIVGISVLIIFLAIIVWLFGTDSIETDKKSMTLTQGEFKPIDVSPEMITIDTNSINTKYEDSAMFVNPYANIQPNNQDEEKKEQIKEESKKGNNLFIKKKTKQKVIEEPVIVVEKKINPLELIAQQTQEKKGLYVKKDQEKQANKSEIKNNIIKCVVHGDQKIISGGKVCLRTIEESVINNEVILKNTFIYGTASVEDNKLRVSINNIRAKNGFIGVSMSVYDNDGEVGLYCNIQKTENENKIKDIGQSVGTTIASSTMGVIGGMGTNALSTLTNSSKNLKIKIYDNQKCFIK